MDKITNTGYLENLYKSLSRLSIQTLHSFEETLEEKLFMDMNTATILVSPYGNADLQEKLLRYIETNNGFYWIYPHKKDDKTLIDDRLQKQFMSVVVEG